MVSAKKILEEKLGPLTVGRLIRGHRTLNDLSLSDFEEKYGYRRAYISDIENGKRNISLEKILEITRAIGDKEEFAAQIWMEEQARRVGMEAKILVKLQAS